MSIDRSWIHTHIKRYIKKQEMKKQEKPAHQLDFIFENNKKKGRFTDPEIIA